MLQVTFVASTIRRTTPDGRIPIKRGHTLSHETFNNPSRMPTSRARGEKIYQSVNREGCTLLCSMPIYRGSIKLKAALSKVSMELCSFRKKWPSFEELRHGNSLTSSVNGVNIFRHMFIDEIEYVYLIIHCRLLKIYITN